MQHGISVDLEDWYALVERRLYARSVPPSSRVVTATRTLLDLLDRCSTQATFFVLGTVAEAFPDLIHEVSERGHEIACHGYAHVRLDRIDSERFRQDIRRATAAIRAACGQRPYGHRAPEFTVLRGTTWALQVLVEEGFHYDSSVFPIAHRRYGIPDSPTRPYVVGTASGTITELPLATLTLLGHRIPTAGGGYLRVFPHAVIEAAIAQATRRGQPAILYVHPYEFDPEPLRMTAPNLSGRLFVQGQNLLRTRAAGGLERLLTSHRFVPLRRLIDE